MSIGGASPPPLAPTLITGNKKKLDTVRKFRSSNAVVLVGTDRSSLLEPTHEKTFDEFTAHER